VRDHGRAEVVAMACALLALAAPSVSAAELFVDATEGSGIALHSQALGVTAGDFDGDGDVDLVFADTSDAEMTLYRNRGDLVFEPETITGPQTNVELAAPIDYDGDGDLDLICGGWPRLWTVLANRGDGTFEDVTPTVGLVTEEAVETAAIAVGDVDVDGDLDVYLGRGRLPDVLCLNDAGQGFVTAEGTLWTSGLLPEATGTEHALFADLTGDGRPDLWVSRYGHECTYYVNDPHGALVDEAERRGLWDLGPDFGAAVLDAEGDGDLDMYLIRGGWHRDSNRLLLNDGQGAFLPGTEASGLGDEGTGFGCAVGDVDLDGDEDVYITNDGGGNRLFLNDGRGRFIDATPETLRLVGASTRGAVLADLDEDGDLDLIVRCRRAQDRVFRNTTDSPNWLRMRVDGPGLNRFGIGARVRVFDAGATGDLAHLRGQREIVAACGWCSAPPPEAHFGVPADGRYDVEVTLPGGVVRTATDVAATQTLVVSSPVTAP